ncbi:hypothetical protein SAMN05444484_103232 [Flavobacterium chilense]|uniref:Uncharacterized protein n=2 Tax=Flavobacterium chilense TaxID=946677 RepID=A0A1M7F5G4_9FLAO|nr:hypothetical protein SAMN05444484_103232 [Flavobacterium chilense]
MWFNSNAQEKSSKSLGYVSKLDTVINNRLIYNYKNKDFYKIYKDINHKYGVSDSYANIIVPASYDRLIKRGEFYYMTYGGQTELFWLDVNNKMLEKVSSFVDFHLRINDSIDVLKNKNEQLNVVINHSNTFLPFEYTLFTKVGDKYFTQKTYSKTVEVLDRNLQKIKTFNKLIDFKILSDKDSTVTAVNINFKTGVLNSRLEILVPFIYNSIIQCSYDRNYYIISQYRNNVLKYGIMDKNFKIVISLLYTNIQEGEKEPYILLTKKNGAKKVIEFNDLTKQF